MERPGSFIHRHKSHATATFLRNNSKIAIDKPTTSPKNCPFSHQILSPGEILTFETVTGRLLELFLTNVSTISFACSAPSVRQSRSWQTRISTPFDTAEKAVAFEIANATRRISRRYNNMVGPTCRMKKMRGKYLKSKFQTRRAE